MTIAPGLEPLGSDPAAPAAPAPPATSDPSISPTPLVSATPPVSPTLPPRLRRIPVFPPGNEARAETAVRATLLLVVTALVLSLSALPAPRPSRAVIEAERLCVELRLTLAELRATVAEHYAAHGTFPGGAPSTHSDPFWIQHQLEVAFRRARAQPGMPVFDLPEPRVPHFTGAVLANPVNQRSSVRFLSPSEPWPLAGDDTTGWLYRPATGEIRANTSGTSPWTGNRYIDM